MPRIVWICIGGAVGTGARYLLSGWALKSFGASFPAGTLAVNLLGCFLIAVTMEIGLETTLLPPTARVALTTGLLGGFTTYSAFGYETLVLHRARAGWGGAMNVVVTTFGCLLATFLGWAATRWVIGR